MVKSAGDRAPGIGITFFYERDSTRSERIILLRVCMIRLSLTNGSRHAAFMHTREGRVDIVSTVGGGSKDQTELNAKVL